MIIVRPSRGNLQLGARSQSTTLETGIDSLLQSVHSCPRARANYEAAGAISMNNVRAQTTIRDLPLDDVATLCLLSQDRDGVVCCDQGVKGVDTFPRSCSSMCLRDKRHVLAHVISQDRALNVPLCQCTQLSMQSMQLYVRAPHLMRCRDARSGRCRHPDLCTRRRSRA